MSLLVSWNGELLPAEQCRVSPDNQNFLLGTGLFETLVTINGRPFAFAHHYERLTVGAEVLGLRVPSQEDLLTAVEALLAGIDLAEEEQRQRIRITLSSEGYLVTATPCETAPESIIAVIDPHPVHERGRLTHIKSSSYAEYALALKAAQGRGAQEAILANSAGDLCEGSTSNVFFARDGILHTPLLACGCLPGVTRKLLLRALRGAGTEIIEGHYPIVDLDTCDELFVTSTIKNVCPVSKLEDRELPIDGPLTSFAREVFEALISV